MDKKYQRPPQTPLVNASRRRLTKAGLAAPAVLGVLASKSVLANVPWICTTSGHLSGNVSGHESESCDLLGSSQAAWQETYPLNADPQTKIKQLFKDLKTDYIFVSLGRLTSESHSNQAASVNQILNLSAPTTQLLNAQKALVLLLNAEGITDNTIYPLTEYQAKMLFVAAATGGNFIDKNPDIDWSSAEYHYYIDLLWRNI